MKAIKVLVIVMGLAIVGGFAVIAFTIAGRLGDRQPEGAWQARVPVPEGCDLAEARLDGNRILLRLEGPASLGCSILLLVDARSGQLLGEIATDPGDLDRPGQ